MWRKCDRMIKVQIDVPDLNIRTGAGLGYAPTGFVTGAGIFEIIETKKGAVNTAGTVGTWGRMSSGAGWICLSVDGVRIIM